MAADVLTPQLAGAFEKKIVTVQTNASLDAKKPRPTQFTQAETNSYLKFKSAPLLPTGLAQPVITLHGEGRVTGRAVVDLDVVRQKQSSFSGADAFQVLQGQLEDVLSHGRY